MGIEVWQAEAPANIALIKYMGKDDEKLNRPANASLSFTLDRLVTCVEVRPSAKAEDSWQPLVKEGFADPGLGESGQARFLKHFAFLKETFEIRGHFEIRSGNCFPADCGLASSASSFAALTKAAYQVALDLGQRERVEIHSLESLSALSRQGSGSSCRSFFSPWALWRDEGAVGVSLPFAYLHHQVVVVSGEKKTVSSSQAHRLVPTSLLFSGRNVRAEARLTHLLTALNERDWRLAYDLTWAEFWDMHALFETSQPAFGYMTANSLAVLDRVRTIWAGHGDGPLVTMDAGPNVHLLYRDDQAELARRLSRDLSQWGRVLE